MNTANITTKKGDSSSGAIFSKCEKYRYILWRFNEESLATNSISPVTYIGLNPSTADELVLDPTCSKCNYFSRAWGYEGYVMLNIFAIRGTDPKILKEVSNPTEVDQIGINNFYILEACRRTLKRNGIIICCWGNHGEILSRGESVKNLLINNNIPIYYLTLNSSGEPRHPLYMPNSTVPKPFK